MIRAMLCMFVMTCLAANAQSIDRTYQWSVPIDAATSSETGGPPVAFLWIPPDCQRVRGVVVGQHNMEEEVILDHPVFRKALAELGLAAVWITPPLDLSFRFDKGVGEHFDAMMASLARESGYRELSKAPIVPIGHSAAASYPFCYAAWKPDRTLAAISVSGQWPFYKHETLPSFDDRVLDGIPGLVTMGEYEWANDRAGEGLKQRAAHSMLPLSMLAEPGAGHFDVSDAKVEYLALYLRKVCEYRLTESRHENGLTDLKPIDPTQQGWLVDRWRYNKQPTAPAAPAKDYQGDASQAFWTFDEEIAHATELFQARYRDQQANLLGYIQNGQVVTQKNGTHQQVTLRFEPLEDGETFKLTGTFIDTVPEGRPERWTGLKAGSSIPHATRGGPVKLRRICGPVEQIDDVTFVIRFYRMGMDNKKRTPEIWLLAEHPGDETFKRMVQQSQMRIPFRHTDGAHQTITFPQIPDQPLGTTSVQLQAISDSGAPVRYYVISGPAEVEGDTLRLVATPSRSNFPVKVKVAAYQYGRASEPKLKTAGPVVVEFSIIKL